MSFEEEKELTGGTLYRYYKKVIELLKIKNRYLTIRGPIMDNFLEKFPSLKNRHHKNKEGLPFITRFFGNKIFNEETVQDACVDKQRLIEALDSEPTFQCDKRLHQPEGCPKCRLDILILYPKISRG